MALGSTRGGGGRAARSRTWLLDAREPRLERALRAAVAAGPEHAGDRQHGEHQHRAGSPAATSGQGKSGGSRRSRCAGRRLGASLGLRGSPAALVPIRCRIGPGRASACRATAWRHRQAAPERRIRGRSRVARRGCRGRDRLARDLGRLQIDGRRRPLPAARPAGPATRRAGSCAGHVTVLWRFAESAIILANSAARRGGQFGPPAASLSFA